MPMITARVLSLPTEADVREEAGRLGVPFASLEPLVGDVGLQAIALQDIPAQIGRDPGDDGARAPWGWWWLWQAKYPHPSPLPHGERG